MGDKTGIEWTDATWNPVTGCDRISSGCDHCYALKQAGRLKLMGQANYQNDGDPRTSGPGFGVTCHPHMLDQPLRWTRPRRVFVNSMSDLFHKDVPDEFILQVFSRMMAATQHTFQVLTKRPQRIAALLSSPEFRDDLIGMPADEDLEPWPWPLPNVWLGTSIENDRYSFRADHLRATPAAVRFVSAEPLLGPLPSLNLTGVDWLIVGGESGSGARPMHPEWVRDLRDRCQLPELNDTYPGDRHTRFHFKQWGEWVPYEMDPQPPFWVSQHGDMIDGHYLPVDLAERGTHDGWTIGDDITVAPIVWRRVGKKKAGRELDGRTWDEFPTAVAR